MLPNLYVHFYVLPNSYMLPNLHVRSYVISNLYVRSYVCLYVLQNLYVRLYVGGSNTKKRKKFKIWEKKIQDVTFITVGPLLMKLYTTTPSILTLVGWPLAKLRT